MRNVGIETPPDPRGEMEWFQAEMGKMVRAKRQIALAFLLTRELLERSGKRGLKKVGKG